MKQHSIVNKEALGCSVLTLLSAVTVHSQNLPEKPNILIIITDQLSSESMSWNIGNKYINTPNIDYLADHGVAFTNAYCANPLSIPSRTSMFTGRYPHETGVQTLNAQKIDPVEFPSLGTIFRSAGYETGYVGKWHLPYNTRATDTHGFVYMKHNSGNGIDSLLPGDAISFLNVKRSNPFLLVVSFIDPHNICEWARGERLPDGDVGTPPAADQCPPLRQNHLPSGNEDDVVKMMRKSYQAAKMFPVSGFDDEKWRQYIWSYYRMIEKVDNQIGKILSVLRESGLDRNTIIILLSDHGDCQGAHQWNQKTVFFEEDTKVPFIISYNGLKPVRSDFLVQTGTDLMPTLCDFAGISLQNKIPGVSLKPVVTKGTIDTRRNFIVVADKMVQGAPVDGNKPEPEGRMLRNSKGFKYWIYNEGAHREALYDLVNDPGETSNLINDPEFKKELNDCRRELSVWARKYNDPFLQSLVK